jgi:hypothetical protein
MPAGCATVVVLGVKQLYQSCAFLSCSTICNRAPLLHRLQHRYCGGTEFGGGFWAGWAGCSHAFSIAMPFCYTMHLQSCPRGRPPCCALVLGILQVLWWHRDWRRLPSWLQPCVQHCNAYLLHYACAKLSKTTPALLCTCPLNFAGNVVAQRLEMAS